MARTVNRQPLNVPVRTLQEKYSNFAGFNGICDNKNYLGIDQQTFIEADNLYMDQGQQLSSRPPLKKISILPIDEKVLEISRINNTVFYHTKKDTEYYLHFLYENEWHVKQVSDKLKILWFDERFIIFQATDIISFNYNYDKKDIEWYDGTATIYIPKTEIVRDGTRTKHESANYLTTSKMTEYIFASVSKIDAVSNAALTDKNVTVQIGDESFSFIWRKNNEKILTSEIGSYEAELIQASTAGTYLASNAYGDEVFYSLDGVLFYAIRIPTREDDNGLSNIVFADDGSSLWGLAYITGVSNKIRLYYLSIPSNILPGDISSLTWTTTDVDAPENYKCNLWASGSYGIGAKIMSSTSWTDFQFAVGTYRFFGHSPENDKFVAVIPMYDGKYKTWQNLSNRYKEDDAGLMSEGGANQFYGLMVVSDGSIKIYAIFTPYKPVDILAYDGNKIRLSPSSSNSLPLIFLSFATTNKDEPNGPQFRGTIVLDSNYVPYHYYDAVVTKSQNPPYTDIYIIRKQYIVSSEIVQQVMRYALIDFYRQDLRIDRAGTLITVSNAFFNIRKQDMLYVATVELGNLVSTWPTNFVSDFEYVGGATDNNPERKKPPLPITLSNFSTVVIDTSTGTSAMYKLGPGKNLLTDRYLRYADTNLPLLQRVDAKNVPILCEGDKIIYYDNKTSKIYTNNKTNEVSVNLLTLGVNNYIVPDRGVSFMADTSVVDPFLIANIVSLNNRAFGSYKRGGQVYLPDTEIQSFPSDVTALANFTKTSVGIFLEEEAYEWLYLTDAYALSRTKLQLGCRKGADVLSNYDGKTIFLTTLKGLNALDYQDFVQSSEQVFSYLTENIMTVYDEYSVSPLKLTQYKNWIFMYRTDINYFYLYDLRNKSWWKWTCQSEPQQIIFDGNDLLISTKGFIYRFDFSFNGANYFDDVGQRINWTCTSQRLHFGAPNNYKHIRSFSILINQAKETPIRCKLKLKSYHDLYNMADTEVVEYDLDEVATMIKKVNFMKLNAFQFTIENDIGDDYPHEFVTPDVAVKYRITERVR